MNERLQYRTGADIPVYRGEFEIIHLNCAFVGTAQHLNRELELEILNRESRPPYCWARFPVDGPLNESQIQQILKPGFDSGILDKARVWCNGATIFEVLINDIVLNSLRSIVSLPFGQIVNCRASSDNERAVVLSPSSEEMSGKELLFEIEEKLKNGSEEAELISYRKLTEDETLNAYTVLEEYQGQWLGLEEERILGAALTRGYFEVPKRITVEQLADSLGMSSTTLNNRLRSINRQILDRFLREWRFPKKR